MQKYEIFSLLTHIHRFFYAHNYGFFIRHDVCIKKKSRSPHGFTTFKSDIKLFFILKKERQCLLLSS